jgi:hypothetical protein
LLHRTGRLNHHQAESNICMGQLEHDSQQLDTGKVSYREETSTHTSRLDQIQASWEFASPFRVRKPAGVFEVVAKPPLGNCSMNTMCVFVEQFPLGVCKISSESQPRDFILESSGNSHAPPCL